MHQHNIKKESLEHIEMVDALAQCIAQCSDAFFTHGSPIRVISHLDADGMTSAAIASAVLSQKNIPFSVSIAPTLDEQTINHYIRDHDSTIMLLDFGSGQLSMLAQYIGNRHVLILDHHEIDECQVPDTFYHVNPRLFGIDGNKDISGAGVVYLWAKHMLGKNAYRLAHFAVCGALGDVQADNTNTATGMSGINSEIVSDALKSKTIYMETVPKIFGLQSKELTKAITYADLNLGDLKGNAGQVEKHLRDIGINTAFGDRPLRYCDLTTQEKNTVCKMLESLSGHADIYWKAYMVHGAQQGTPFSELRELATLLNACGRLKKPSIGIGALLGDPGCIDLAHVVSDTYKKRIVEAIKWYRDHQQDQQFVMRSSSYIIIRAGTAVLGTMIGTLASIIANDADVSDGTLILSMAHTDDHMTKVSVRVCGNRDSADPTTDMSALMRQVTQSIGKGQAGGHAMAAGAVIPMDAEDSFIQAFIDIMNQQQETSPISQET